MLRFWQRRKDDERSEGRSAADAEVPSRRNPEDEGPFQPGIQIAGKFTLTRLIAAGSMGTVFEAWDMFVERSVAIKLMRPGFDRDPGMIARFRREAQTTASIQHPNVVTIHEVGQRRDGTFYMVQELLVGETLREYLAPRGRLSEHEAMNIMVPIMGALIAAHRRGIVHRDVKPENIILTNPTQGEIVPKLVDFGLARVHESNAGRNKLTLSGVVMGTPEYMAPEQAQGHPGVDARADVWSVGAILFELLSGKRPYDGPTHQAVLVKLVTQPPPILSMLVDDIPAAFLEVVQGALVPEREKRIQSMQLFRDKLILAFEQMSRRVVVAAGGVPEDSANEKDGPPSDTITRVGEMTSGDVLELDPGDLVLDEDTQTDDTALTSTPEAPLSTLARSELEWQDPESTLNQPLSAEENKAFDALSVNALREAADLAERAIKASGSSAARARMRLVQAIAYRWLGKHKETRRAAEEAMSLLQRGGTGFHAALGHLIQAAGSLGEVGLVKAIAEEIDALEHEGVTSEAHVVSACRLIITLVRMGMPDRAHALLKRALKIAHKHEVTSSFVLAWLDVARAEVAVHEGDLTTYVRRVESAVENFTSAGDQRNACLQRCNIGNAYLQLGAYQLAVTAFREALAIAEPMKLDFTSSILANLGYGLARMGDIEEALKVEQSAFERVVAQGNRRGQGFVQVYLSMILRLAGRIDEAQEMAERAIAVSDGIPGVRAYALALLAGIAIVKNAEGEALGRAEEAQDILDKLGGVEEGESLIRSTYALALRVVGREEEAQRRITEARRRLLVRADKISDPRWRQSFLEQVPDNARVMEFAAVWLGER